MDIRTTLAAREYTAAQNAAPAGDGAGQALSRAASEFARTMEQGEQTAIAAMTGGADAHALVQALAQTELAVEAAVTIRDKVVEAYQEILRMPV